MRRVLIAAGSSLLVIAVACGSDPDPIAGSPDAGPDTSVSASSSGFATDSGPVAPVDTGAPLPGPKVCPPYQALCDGACIPTTDDANNCGGCGKKCTGAQACSSGVCADTCATGLGICANRCVDTQTDNAHCGGCGKPCGAGKGCVAGTCETAIVVGPGPATCAGGGPPIDVGTDLGGCLGNIAQKTFRWSLCSCKDVVFSAALTADGYDSTKGPYAAGGIGGGVGANGDEKSTNTAFIGGDLWARGTQGLNSAGEHTVKHDLRLNGKLQTSAPFSIGHDAWINGDIQTSSTVAVTNELRVPQAASFPPGVTSKTLTRGVVDVPTPCDCSTAQLVPTVAIVKAHDGTKNDNASIGLAANALAAPAGPTRLDLPCGQFFLSGIGGAHPITIAAHGRTALYIDGNIQTTGDLAFVVDPIGELDVFVSGSVGSSAQLRIGSPNYPALTRTYIGSTSDFALSAQVRIAGNLYVAGGRVAWSAASDLYGAVFAGDFTASAETRLHYDRAVLHAGDACPGGPASGGGTSDAGAACGSCRDCNNQACKGGTCGACSANSDCCSPLECVEGQCIPAIK